MEKMTYVVALNSAISCEALSEEVREKLSALLEQQKKRNNAEKKPTKTQQANEVLKDALYDLLVTADKAMTVTEILQMANHPAMTSNQKVAGLLRQLKDEGRVERVEEKRKAYFKAVR